MLNLLFVFALGRSPAALTCEAKLLPRVALAAVLITNVPARANETLALCKPTVNPQIPREVDVRFPDKTVRIVGHIHPAGRGDDMSFEPYLADVLEDSHSDSTPLKQATLRWRLERYAALNAQAMDYWREDVNILNGLSGRVGYVFAEYGPNALARLQSEHQTRFDRGSHLLPALGFSPTEVDGFLAITLTPGYFLRHTSPNFHVPVGSVEPSTPEIEAYDRKFCPEKSERADAAGVRTAAARGRLFASLILRGYSPRVALSQLESGMNAVIEFVRGADSRVTTESDFVNAFQSGSGLDLTEAELAELRTVVGYQTWNDQTIGEIIRRVPEELKSYTGCDGRNALIAKKLAETDRDSVTFIGAAHLAPVGAGLGRECRAKMR